jgi:uncharacterized membrane protein
MPFEGEFITKILDDKWAMLKEPVIFKSSLFGDTFKSKTGFITDFASVPRVPILYMFLGGRGKRSAANHDDGYLRQEESKRRVDFRFYEGLLATFVYDAVKAYVNSDENTKSCIKNKQLRAILAFWLIIWRFVIATLMWCPGVVIFAWPTWLKYKYRKAKGLPMRPEAPDVEDYRWEDYVF